MQSSTRLNSRVGEGCCLCAAHVLRAAPRKFSARVRIAHVVAIESVMRAGQRCPRPRKTNRKSHSLRATRVRDRHCGGRRGVGQRVTARSRLIAGMWNRSQRSVSEGLSKSAHWTVCWPKSAPRPRSWRKIAIDLWRKFPTQKKPSPCRPDPPFSSPAPLAYRSLRPRRRHALPDTWSRGAQGFRRSKVYQVFLVSVFPIGVISAHRGPVFFRRISELPTMNG